MKKGFSYISVISSISILILCMVLVVSGASTYHRNLYAIKTVHKLENIVRKEAILLNATKSYSSRQIDGVKIEYESMGSQIYNHNIIETVKIRVEDEESGAKSEYVLAFRK